jgi:hypothetical protein
VKSGRKSKHGKGDKTVKSERDEGGKCEWQITWNILFIIFIYIFGTKFLFVEFFFFCLFVVCLFAANESQIATPVDAQSMKQLLQSMDVPNHESRVVNQLLEFAHSQCIFCQ